jgi:hypothetical protein
MLNMIIVKHVTWEQSFESIEQSFVIILYIFLPLIYLEEICENSIDVHRSRLVFFKGALSNIEQIPRIDC